jgi:hypothetical protein
MVNVQVYQYGTNEPTLDPPIKWSEKSYNSSSILTAPQSIIQIFKVSVYIFHFCVLASGLFT